MRPLAVSPRLLRVLLVAALAAHFYGLYGPSEPGTVQLFPGADKVFHAVGFAVPSALAVLAARRWWPIAAFAAHAVVSELVQAWFLPGRDGDPWDVAADLTGVMLASAVCWPVLRHPSWAAIRTR